VLDNFEQVQAAAHQVGELLTRLPDARVLATSRSPLRVYGEQEYPVPPLELPDTATADPESLSHFASVALFVERAMAVRPDFTVNASNAPAIAQICVSLDGLPLAIELAAARVRVLTPQAILSRLGDRLSILGGGASDLPARQQTLRGAIDWSYDLLETADRTVFARMAVFAGGADLAAVEQVALADWPADGGPRPDALDAVASLLDKSLLRHDVTDDPEPRYHMLGTIRAYAMERLDSLDADGAVKRRHAEYYLGLAQRLSADVFGDRQRVSLDMFEREHDNLRAAMVWAIERSDATVARRLLAACWRFWQMRGYLPEARDKADRVLALSGGDEADRLTTLDAAGGIAYWQGDIMAARDWYQQERELADTLGDERGVAEALYNESFTFSVEPKAADLEEARRLAEDALARFRKLGDRAGEGKALWGVVNSYVFMKDTAPGLAMVDEAIGISREFGDRFQLGWGLFTKGLLLTQKGEFEDARSPYRQALDIFGQTSDVTGYALVLDAIAALEWAEGDQDRALRIAGAASSIHDVAGIGLAQINRQAVSFYPEEMTTTAELAEAYAAGKALSIDEAIDLALHKDRPGTA
jgi:predicted ATPase